MRITIQSTRGRKSFVFDDKVTACEVITQATHSFNFPDTYKYGLLLSENAVTPLDADRTLASYGVYGGASLFLAITGC